MTTEELEFQSGDGSSELVNGGIHGRDLGYDDEDEFGGYPKYRKEQILQLIDFLELRTKICCTTITQSQATAGFWRAKMTFKVS